MTNSFGEDQNARGPVVRERSTYMTDSDAKRMCSLFADGLQTGMGLSRVLEMMERQGFDEKIVHRLRASLVENGDMLGEAFARFGILDPAARKLILVAEQQGKLPGTFRQLSLIYGKRHDRKKRFFYSLVEPAVLIILGLIVARNLVSALEDIITEDDTTGAMTSIFIQSGIESVLFALFCGIIIMISMNLPVDFGLRATCHRMVLRIPLVGEAGNLYAISTFCRYVKQSLASGLTAYRAMELAAEAANSPKILDRIAKAQEHIAEGGTIAQALYSIKAFPGEVIEAIDIGEESGHLEERLQALSERYELLSNEAFERLITTAIYVLRMLVVIVTISMIFMVLLKIDLGI